MWPRTVEIMTGVWLSFSPFIFGAQDNPVVLWGDLGVALLLWIFAGAAHWPPLKRIHLAILPVAVGLFLWGRFATDSAPPEHQNHIAVAILLVMVAIIPNEASLPPENWRADSPAGD